MACTACATKENPKWKFLKALSTRQNTNKNFLFKSRSYSYFCTPYVLTHNAEVAQLVEHNLAKVGVAGSNLVFRSQNSIFDGIFSLGQNLLCLVCLGGGIGRHAGLKILFAEKASAGSIPARGT